MVKGAPGHEGEENDSLDYLRLHASDGVDIVGDDENIEIRIKSLVDPAVDIRTIKLSFGDAGIPVEKVAQFLDGLCDGMRMILESTDRDAYPIPWAKSVAINSIVSDVMHSSGLAGTGFGIEYVTHTEDPQYWYGERVQKKKIVEDVKGDVEGVYDVERIRELIQIIEDSLAGKPDVNLNDRQWAVEELALMTPTAATLDSFIEFFKEGSTKHRRALLKAIAKSEDPKATTLITGALLDADEEIRWLAAYHLGKRSLSDADKHIIEQKFIKPSHKKGRLAKLLGVFALLRSDEFKNSPFRVSLINNFRRFDYPTLSILIAQAPNLLERDAAIEFVSLFSVNKSAGIRESVLDSLITLDAESSRIELFSKDEDSHTSRKARKHLGENVEAELPSIERSKVEGLLYGAAIGDSVGAPIEFLRVQQIMDIYGDEVDDYVDLKSHDQRFRMQVGEISDDAGMGFMIMEGGVDDGYLEMSKVGANFGQEMEDIDSARKPNIGYPLKSSFDMRKLGLGCNWRLSGHKGAKGCGAAMRVFPVALFAKDDAELVERAADTAILTHYSDMGRGSAVLVAKAMDIVLKEKVDLSDEDEVRKYVDRVVESARVFSEELAEAVSKIPELLKKPVSEALEVLGTDGEAIETVPAALYCFLKSPNDFTATLRSSINVDGDSDSIGAIACALSGAYNGVEGIPEHLKEGLVQKDYIEDLAGRYFKK
ncbi:hypothetical protein HN709_03490 [Candidatus Peregrinibacteria bacterium]|jgi:ADP-ribosylglycohydrolase|nr:hypothetical protein [Candidatus Peregrinibacteria bacterium]MBT7736729.1 hypothetical protein [Candidatus Peregrinibacteria bacterium]